MKCVLIKKFVVSFFLCAGGMKNSETHARLGRRLDLLGKANQCKG